MGGYLFRALVLFYNTDRKILYSTSDSSVKKTAHNNHRSWDILVGFQGGFKIPIPEIFTPNLFIVPSINLDYLNVFEGGYRESGAGPINLSVKNHHSAYLRSEMILRFLKELAVGPFLFFPNIYIGWLKNVPLTNGKYNSRFYKETLCRKNFTVQSYHNSTDQLILGAEIETICISNMSLRLGYEANIGNHYSVQEGTLRFNWSF